MDKDELRIVKVPVCRLFGPPDCQYRVNGGGSGIKLCGGNEQIIKNCPFRQVLLANETEKITIKF